MLTDSQWTDLVTLVSIMDPQTEVTRECVSARTDKQEDHLGGANRRRRQPGKRTTRAERETPQKLEVELVLVALKTTETLQGAVTGTVKRHLSPRNLQIQKRIQKVTKVKQDPRKSPRLRTEMLHNLTEMTEAKTSGRTREVLVSKEKVPMGRPIRIATSLLVVITSKYLEEVQLMGAKDFLPVPRITAGMQMGTGHTV